MSSVAAGLADLRANPSQFAAAARAQVNARAGIEGADICGVAASLAGALFVCANPPGHEDESNGTKACGHRFVHDTRQGQS